MSKFFLVVFIYLWGCGLIRAQTVVSSCIAPDSIISKYINDADRLAVRKFYRNNLPEKDSIIIPEAHRDTALKALIAVYNAVGIAERDTVIDFLDIHTFPNPNLNQIIITADTNLFWVQQIKNGIVPTGEPTIDSIISNYYLYILYYNQSSINPWAFITFKTDTNYNMSAMTVLFDSIPGIYYAEPGGWGGDGNNLTDSIYSTHIELIYSYGWGDCLAGCICRRYWKFEVDFNCNVTFAGSYTNFPSFCELPFTGVPENEKFELITVKPNPFTDYVLVNDGDRYNYTIYNITGKKVFEGATPNSKIDNLEVLKPGLYFLNIWNDKNSGVFKILKD